MKINTILDLSLFFFIIICERMFLAKAQNTTVPVDVGVVLDMDTRNGKVGWSCINMALSDFYASHPFYKTRLRLNIRDSKRDVVGAAAAALYLIKKAEVQAIIGPQNSMQANFVIDLGKKAQVPIISFSATSSSLTSLQSPYFFQVTQKDSSQVKAISAIIQAFGWKEVVPIYVHNSYGAGIIPYFVNALQEIYVRIPYQSVIPPSATSDQIGQELYNLMTMQTRVFIVHMSHNLSSLLFTMAKKIGMMREGYVWIITNGIANSFTSIKPSILHSMQGVLGIKTYIPKTKEHEDFTIRWKRKFRPNNPNFIDAELDVVSLWAYDATSALARAVEKAGITNLGFEKTYASSNLTDLETIKVSQDGPKIREALLGVRFTGLAGEFSLVNGQLQSSNFEIINVNGNGERGIAFWTPENGLIRKLNSANKSAYSTSKSNLGLIIWPGDSSTVPKGWEIPTNRKKLKIGVPVKPGFHEFVNVAHDPSTNTTQVTGYCIDIFNAVMKTLPYTVSYEFIPFAKPDGSSFGTYDELVHQVFLKKLDAVVGDTTITSARSNFVDLLRYTESGVSMVVPIKASRTKNAWVFLRPLTWDLWVTSGCFFVFIGFVVWILEHRINDDFRGPPSHQIGTSLWFTFSTMVFSHRETVLSNCARFVVIVWLFVVFILTQSYTASLTSLLTVQQLQPIGDIDQLIKKGEYVGFQRGSLILGFLKEMKFDISKLKEYNSLEECYELLSKGSANGGIAAAFDEIPYMKLFLGQYCSKFVMVGSIFKPDSFGFGFVFPRGSPLLDDVSWAILNVTEGEKKKQIDEKWLEKKTNCTTDSFSSQDSSDSLSLASFWGLFLIAGVASSSAVIFSVCMFLYKERLQILMPFASEGSLGRRIRHTFRIFDRKDLTSHTLKNRALEDKSNTNCPPTPSSHSTQEESLFASDHLSPNGQVPSQPAPAVELIVHPNQEGSSV